MRTVVDPPRASFRSELTPAASSSSPGHPPTGAPRERAPVPPSRATPAGAARPLPPLLTGLRALVVDDDADTRELFAAVLATGGATALQAGSASEALAVLAEQPVDVVLSDIAMPGGDGYWLVRQIRALPDTPVNAVPVVAVTAFGREHSRARALAAGFADHLQKPTDPALLCRAVAAAAGR